MKNPEKPMLAGDWHGNTSWAVAAIQHAYAEGCDTILQLGDFGFWTPGPAWRCRRASAGSHYNSDYRRRKLVPQ